MIEKNKEAQTQTLTELQQELKSLKTLLLSRGPSVAGVVTPPFPITSKPSIPAWQLASGGEEPSSNVSPFRPGLPTSGDKPESSGSSMSNATTESTSTV